MRDWPLHVRRSKNPAGMKRRPNLTDHSCGACGVRTPAEGVDPKGNAIVAVQVATLEGADAEVLAKSGRYVDGRYDHF